MALETYTHTRSEACALNTLLGCSDLCTYCLCGQKVVGPEPVALEVGEALGVQASCSSPVSGYRPVLTHFTTSPASTCIKHTLRYYSNNVRSQTERPRRAYFSMCASPTNTLRSWTKDGSTSSSAVLLLMRMTPERTQMRCFLLLRCCVLALVCAHTHTHSPSGVLRQTHIRSNQ